MLAQIELSEAEAALTLDKLNGIFTLVEQLKAVDTTGIAPLNHPIEVCRPQLALRLRDDIVTEADRRTEYQQNAPALRDHLFLVPKVID